MIYIYKYIRSKTIKRYLCKMLLKFELFPGLDTINYYKWIIDINISV